MADEQAKREESTRPGGEKPAGTARRDRRLDDVFGEVLPETTSDEREPRADRQASDEWYLDNRPPHHGG
ncbi:hypothetical protein ABZ639_28525 [Saccharomonospora sp. NPDC006951]